MCRRASFKLAVALVIAMSVTSCSVPEDTDTDVVRGVNFVGMSVSDLDRSEAFYAAGTDLRRVETNSVSGSAVLDSAAGRPGVQAETRLLRGVNGQIRLMRFADRSQRAQSAPQMQVYGPGIAHICFQVDKATGSYQRLLDAGAEPIGARDMVQLNPRRPVDYAYVRDPDGLIVEVEHVDIAALDLPKPPKNKYRIRHVALATPDIERAVAFYSILLNEKNPRRLGDGLFALSGENFDKLSGLPGTRLKMAFFQVRNMELEISEYISHPTEDLKSPRPVDALGYNMIVFDVADLDAARQKLMAAGGEVVGAPESLDGGQILFGRDPDGNLLGFQGVASDAVVSSQNFDGDGT